MNIAVIGSGISGLSAAWLLQQKHQVTLYEAAAYAGGHTNTVDVSLDGHTWPVDTGFLVHNELTYPNLIRLFEHLDIETHETEMTFSVIQRDESIEWAGTSLATVFAQKRNLLRPRFWQMLKDILRFNSAAEEYLEWSQLHGASLGELLDEHRYCKSFRNGYLLPMAASIWSSSPRDILTFPASTFLCFCLNHHLLQIEGRPQWRSIIGGGRNYVNRMTEKLDIRLNHPVDSVNRENGEVLVKSRGETAIFDAVVLATHAPDSLRMLEDADLTEREILGSVRYQPNSSILHADRSFLPGRESLWSAWNYMSTVDDSGAVCVTYLLNHLQRLPFESPLMVTLNPPPGHQPQNPIASFEYAHPVFDQAAIDAQKRLPEIQGINKSWYCGAWCGYGFHEDGLKSALSLLPDFDVEAPWPVKL